MAHLNRLLGAMSQADPVQQWWRQQLGFNPEQEAMGAIGPNARSILNYQNDPSATRPAARSGWPTRFAGLGAERAARREEDTRTAYSGLRPATVAGDKSPEELAEDIRGAREGEWADLTTERMDRGLPVTPDSMTTHGGRAGTMVSALPRPLDRVEAELSGKPNFDRAAGPQNEKWQAARDRRDARREEAREAITEREARKADNRRRRLEQRREPPRPATAGGMGALWRIDPVAAARIGAQQQQSQAYQGIQQQRLRQQQQQFETRRPLMEEELRGTRMQNELMEEATTEEKQLQSRWDELQEGIVAAKGAGQPEEAAKLQQQQNEVEDQLEQARQRTDRLSGAGAGGQGGGIPTPRTVGQRGEPISATQEDEFGYRRIPRTSPVRQALGEDFNNIDPTTAASTLASWKRDNPNARVPTDNEIDALIPKLQQAGINEELVRERQDAEQNAIIAAAHPMYEGEPVEAARKRVRAAMDYFGKPVRERGEAPVVGGRRLKAEKETRPYKTRGFGPADRDFYHYTWEEAD